MITRRRQRFESMNVQKILDAIEEFSGQRFTEKELRERDCWVYNQHRGGGHCIVKLHGQGNGMYLRTYWYAATRRECERLIRETAESLGPNFVQDYEDDLFAAVWEEYTTALDEADFNSIEELLTLKTPNNEDDIMQFLDASCEEQLNVLIHLTERDYEDILSAWEEFFGDRDDEDDESTYERRCRKESAHKAIRMRNRRITRR